MRILDFDEVNYGGTRRGDDTRLMLAFDDPHILLGYTFRTPCNFIHAGKPELL